MNPSKVTNATPIKGKLHIDDASAVQVNDWVTNRGGVVEWTVWHDFTDSSGTPHRGSQKRYTPRLNEDGTDFPAPSERCDDSMVGVYHQEDIIVSHKLCFTHFEVKWTTVVKDKLQRASQRRMNEALAKCRKQNANTYWEVKGDTVIIYYAVHTPLAVYIEALAKAVTINND